VGEGKKKGEKREGEETNEPSDEMLIRSPFLLLHNLVSLEVLLHREPSGDTPVSCPKTKQKETGSSATNGRDGEEGRRKEK